MKSVRIIILLSILMLLNGCSRMEVSNMTNLEKVEKMVNEMVSYEAEANITFTKNKKSSTMKVQQIYSMEGPYELTILEPEHVSGYKTAYDGNKITEYNPVTDKSVQVEASPVKNEVLFGTFVHNYLESGTKKISEEADGNYIVLETVIPGDYKYMAYEKTWFDQETQNPVKTEIYGQDGTVTISIDILSFKYNEITE